MSNCWNMMLWWECSWRNCRQGWIEGWSIIRRWCSWQWKECKSKNHTPRSCHTLSKIWCLLENRNSKRLGRYRQARQLCHYLHNWQNRYLSNQLKFWISVWKVWSLFFSYSKMQESDVRFHGRTKWKIAPCNWRSAIVWVQAPRITDIGVGCSISIFAWVSEKSSTI